MADSFNNWDKIADALPKITSQIVRKTAFDVQAGYQQRVHVDTGFEKNAAYVVTSESSNYGQASPTHKGSYLLPEVERPGDDQTAYVADGANYAYIEEFGGAHHPAHPAMVPALEAARGPFEQALGEIEQKLKEATQ